jgi:squalene synthase HpnC
LSSQPDVIPAKAVPNGGLSLPINSKEGDGIQSTVLDPGFRRGDGNLLPPAVAQPLDRSWTEAEAFAYCSQLTRSHYENFPVGSLLLPKNLQPAIHSLYAFMRTADDFSDEDRRPGDEAERLAWLETWDQMLLDCQKGSARHPIFIALRAMLDRYKLPVEWLRDLLRAFKQDVTVRRYATYEDLLTYCRYSANPVGRLILTLFGYRDEELYRLSDAICTGLQLANHWQDVAVDLQKDRIYLPQEDMVRFGIPSSPHVVSGDPGALRKDSGPPTEALGGDGFRQLMAFEVARARGLFVTGRSLPEKVQGRLRWELRFTWSGGMRILDKIEAVDYDVFRHRPVVTKLDWALVALRGAFFHG